MAIFTTVSAEGLATDTILMFGGCMVCLSFDDLPSKDNPFEIIHRQSIRVDFSIVVKHHDIPPLKYQPGHPSGSPVAYSIFQV